MKMKAGSISTIATHRVQLGGDQTWATGAFANAQTRKTKLAIESSEKATLKPVSPRRWTSRPRSGKVGTRWMPRKMTIATMRSVMASSCRSAELASARDRRTEAVRPRRAGEEAALDQEPDSADDGDQQDQHPPAGFIAVVPALDVDEDGRDDDDQRENAAQQAEAILRAVSPEGHVDERQNDADDQGRQHESEPELSPVHAPLW